MRQPMLSAVLTGYSIQRLEPGTMIAKRNILVFPKIEVSVVAGTCGKLRVWGTVRIIVVGVYIEV